LSLADAVPAVATRSAGKHSGLAIKTDLSERIFGCEECGSCFTKAALLKRHQITHTGQ